MSLTKKTIKGLSWSSLSQIFRQATQFVITAILARLLIPEDFGLLGMVIVFSTFARIFVETGISEALIQKESVTDKHFYSAFWVNLALAVIMMFLFILVAPIISGFYETEALKPIIIAMSINIVIVACSVIPRTLLERDMHFDKIAFADMGAVILGGGVAICMAFSGYGVWSLVFNLIVTALSSTVFLWKLAEWRPRFTFSIQAIKDVFKFSTHLISFNVINYFEDNLDYLLIGKFFGAEALGYYTLAYKLMLVPLRNISQAIARVMFPALSKIQKNLNKVRNAYLKMIKVISLVAFPMMCVLFAVSTQFILVVYGEQWTPVIRLLQILCFCGMAKAISTTAGSIILSQGRSDLQLKLGILGAIGAALAILAGLKWGMYGVAFTYTVWQIGWWLYVQRRVNSLMSLENKVFFKALFKGSLIGIVLIAVLSAVRLLNTSNSNLLFLSIIFGGIIYLLFLFLLKEISYSRRRIKISLLGL